MTYSSVVISAGHSKYVRGAAGPRPWGLDEVDEARRVTTQLAAELRLRGVNVVTYFDDISKTQDENLKRITDFHNSKTRQLDLSIHFNASSITSEPRGCEVFHCAGNSAMKKFAAELSAAIAKSGFKDRGAKSDSLYFTSNTSAPACLLEICFVDSSHDAALYGEKFNQVCRDLADTIGGFHADVDGETPAEPEPPPLLTEALFQVTGKCSWFGGPNDTTGVSASEGLAFHYDLTPENQHLFLPLQPAGSTGLARRLNSKAVGYVACRWDYAVTPKTMLASSEDLALVRATKTGREALAYPADWGPSDTKTDRVADLSEFLMKTLGISTDDEVTVTYPYRPNA